jgi:hypothetical protein
MPLTDPRSHHIRRGTMDGNKLVGIMGVAFVLTASFFWYVGLSYQAEMEASAIALGVPKLTQEQAAAEVARDDKFGLPSRMANPPGREISRAWQEGTFDNPFPATEAGVVTMFDVYAVTVKGCRSQLPRPEKDASEHLLYATLVTVGEVGRVAGVHVGAGEPTRTRAFTNCIAGGIAQAVFLPPDGGEATFSTRVKIP